MITFEELQDRAAGEHESKAGFAFLGIVISAFVYVLATHIFERCIKTRRLSLETAHNPGFIGRWRLRRIMKNLANHPTVVRAARNAGVHPSEVYKLCAEEALQQALRVGMTLDREDLE